MRALRPISKRFHQAVCCTLAGMMLISPATPSVQAESWWSKKGRKHEPQAACTVESLAQEMDWLEHFIDTYGTITAKAPDIWGEQRLIKHRQEFERQMAAELGTFEPKLNAAVARSDQAFLSSATALSFAISGPSAVTDVDNDSKNLIKVPDITIANSTDVTSATLAPVEEGGKPTGAFKLASDGSNVIITRAPSRAQTQSLLGFENTTLSLEPTVVIDQQKRFLDHLHAIRRLNDGDDISDTPCYSLNLVRIPISVLPGKQTRKGHGAEITITAEPVLSESLLPTTLRSLIVNETYETFSTIIHNRFADKEELACQTSQRQYPSSGIQLTGAETVVPDVTDFDKAILPLSEMQDRTFSLGTEPENNLASASSIKDAFTEADLEGIAEAVEETLKSTDRESDLILDIRTALAAEADQAYEMLMQDVFGSLWMHDQVLGLAKSIRTGCVGEIMARRKEFFDLLSNVCRPNPQLPHARTPNRPQDHVAWAVYYFSVLANDRLIRDMKEMGPALKCPQCSAEGQVFVGPHTGPEAAQIFNEYVKCRWPIRVFALDPIVDEQNVADAFSRRRELQLAMAMKFASGNMSASNLTKFVRRLEWDMNVIALNRTAIGFNHDNDTFGWRFYPRVQTPPVKGNIGTFVETWVGGPTTDQDLSKRQIEPGQRECIAIVLMPAFVPYVRFDTRSNWFKLTNPKATEVTIQDAMRMSQSIRRMSNVSQGVVDAHLYREGEIERLQRRVDQLSKELPLQTIHSQTPIDVDVTAAEAFATGVEELTPAVYGAYGEPGVVLGQPTTLFVVGRNFSVHETKVIAGNVDCRFELISRHIMKVTIPPDARPVEHQESNGHEDVELCSCKDQHIDLHVATPYGVSKHLKVPVVPASGGSTTPSFEWRPMKYEIEAGWKKPDGQPVAIPYVKLYETSQKLSIAIPPGYLHSGSPTLTIYYVLDNGLILGKSDNKSLTFDSARGYTLPLGEITTDLTTAVLSYVNGRPFAGDSSLPRDVKLVAKLTIPAVTVEVVGDAHVTIKYQAAP